MNQSKIILTTQQANRKLRRMALEIAERNAGESSLILIGIRENGSYISKKIESYLKEFYKNEIHVADISINKKNPVEISFSSSLNIQNRCVILIDDVANSGRTFLYAMHPLLKLLPSGIQTLALVERTHKLFPVNIDYTGISVSTTAGENISVVIKDGEVETVTLENI